MQKVILVLALVACDDVVVVPDPGDLADIAEQYCADHPELPCGHVYACTTPADNELGRVEVCISRWQDVAEAEALYGPCELSPHERFSESHLCWWCCGEGCGRGCNSYSGCLCF